MVGRLVTGWLVGSVEQMKVFLPSASETHADQ